jgi:hypothetical protein
MPGARSSKPSACTETSNAGVVAAFAVTTLLQHPNKQDQAALAGGIANTA